MGYSVAVAGNSDVGCVRSNNEDNFGFDTRYGIFVVCDGMGGQAAGEVASKLSVDAVLEYFRRAGPGHHYKQIGDRFDGLSARANALASAIQLANQAVHQAATEKAGQAGMGSTIVAVLADGAFFSVGHVGDSRIYLIRDGAIQQLTNDHSLVMEQVRLGMITLAEARTSQMQNVIVRALGTEPSVQPDLDDLVAAPGDVLVLCSDGLTRHVSDDAILEAVMSTPDVEQACNRLVQAARDGGGEDNITCLLLRFEEQPWYKKMLNSVAAGGSPKWQNSF